MHVQMAHLEGTPLLRLARQPPQRAFPKKGAAVAAAAAAAPQRHASWLRLVRICICKVQCCGNLKQPSAEMYIGSNVESV